MRFIHRLYKQSTPQWFDCYINYVQLKLMVLLIKDSVMQRKNINKAIQKRQQNKNNNASARIELLVQKTIQERQAKYTKRYKQIGDQVNKMFCQSLEKQTNLCADFVMFKYEQIQHKFAKVRVYRQLIRKQKNNRKRKKIAKPFVQYLFVQAYLLSMMVSMNIQSQRKIIQKHKLYSQNVFETPSIKFSQIVSIDKCNTLYRTIQHYYFDQVSRRKKKQDKFRLRKLAQQITKKSSQLLPVGIMIGLFIATGTFLGIILGTQNKSIESDPIFNKDFSHWRGIAFIIFYIWSLGLNIYYYQKYNINHRVILQNNYTIYPTSIGAFRFASVLSVLFIVFFTLYALEIVDIINLGSMPPQLLAIFVWVPFILIMINPFHLVYYRTRGYTYKLLLKIIASFFIPITFPIIWGTDQLVSLFTPFQDLIETVCYYSTINIVSDQQVLQTHDCRNPAVMATFIFSIVVYSYRIMQCLKIGFGFNQNKYWKKSQFLNCIKYGLALITAVLSFVWKKTTSGTILPVWITFGIITTLFSFIWDLKVDWDLLHLKSHNFLLRDRITYDKHIYYISIFINFLLRCTWIFYISPVITKNLLGSVQLFILIFGLLEIARRAIWNMFRVQVQHIRNCQVLRALPRQFQRLEQQIDQQLEDSRKQNRPNFQSLQRISQEKTKVEDKRKNPEDEKFMEKQKQLVKTTKRKRELCLQQKDYLKDLLKQSGEMKKVVQFEICNVD